MKFYKFRARLVRALPTKRVGNWTGCAVAFKDWPIEVALIVNSRVMRHPSMARLEVPIGEVRVFERRVKMLEVSGGGFPVVVAPEDTFSFAFAEDDMRQEIEVLGVARSAAPPAMEWISSNENATLYLEDVTETDVEETPR